MRRILFTSLSLLMAPFADAQCDTIARVCERHITTAYIPDGQFYRALLTGDELAEFDMTLFGGTTYRVAACSGLTDGNLIFSVYDTQRNLLFSNQGHGNEPYWDLVVANTIDVRIEAALDPAKAGSGCAVMLIGFKR
ncbi:MAG: hypothetical protein JNM31_12715 [Flavobacteriales bacterium]|nr:hypothetical protein [Flavobacteriales bacterium]